jgi:hypothetical protein
MTQEEFMEAFKTVVNIRGYTVLVSVPHNASVR